MSGRFIISLTGGILLFLRFINRLFGFVLFFTGLWIVGLAFFISWLITQQGNFFTFETREFIAQIVVMVGGVLALCSFLTNCGKLFDTMPDNKLKRFLFSFVNKEYSPEREGNNFPEFMKSTTRDNLGFFFGVKHKVSLIWRDKFFVGKPTNEDGHIVVIGGAGSGKSSCIAIPTLKTWTGSIFAIDIKGELSAYYAGLPDQGKRPFVIFDPMDENSKGFDPYHLLRTGGSEFLVQNAREIALSIVPLPQGVKDPFWIQGAQNVLTGAILHYFTLEEGLTFIETIHTIQTTPIEMLIFDIAESKNTVASMYVNQIQDLETKIKAGIGTELSNKIMTFATDPFICQALSKSKEDCILLDSYPGIDCEEQNIFIRLPEDKLEQWGSLVTLMINQRIRSYERRPDKTTKEGKLIAPALLLLDEFPRLGKIESIKGALATLRSKSVTICLMIQSLAQLDEIYGHDARRTILDNCPYKAILKVTDADSQMYFSLLSGSSEVEKKGYSITYDPDSGIQKTSSDNFSLQREPIVYPHEFAKLTDIVLMHPEGYSRVDKAPYYEQEEEPPPPKSPPMKVTDVTDPIIKSVTKASSASQGFYKAVSRKTRKPSQKAHIKINWRNIGILVAVLALIAVLIMFVIVPAISTASANGASAEPLPYRVENPSEREPPPAMPTNTPEDAQPPATDPTPAPEPAIEPTPEPITDPAPEPEIEAPNLLYASHILDHQDNRMVFVLSSGHEVYTEFLGITPEGKSSYFVDFYPHEQVLVGVSEGLIFHADPDTTEIVAGADMVNTIPNHLGGLTLEAHSGSIIAITNATFFVVENQQQPPTNPPGVIIPPGQPQMFIDGRYRPVIVNANGHATHYIDEAGNIISLWD